MPDLKHSELPLPVSLSWKAGRAVTVANRRELRVTRKVKKAETFMLFFSLRRKVVYI